MSSLDLCCFACFRYFLNKINFHNFTQNIFLFGMPGVSKKRSQSRAAIANRWPQPIVVPMETEEEVSDAYTIENDIEHIDYHATDFEEFSETFDVSDISDLFELCQQQGSLKNISLLLYMTLRYFKINWRSIDDLLGEIGALRCFTVHKWAKIFLSNDFIEYNSDLRGGKSIPSFYDVYPDIEIDAKIYATSQCEKKSSDFKAADLRDFIDAQFYEVTGLQKQPGNSFIRSERSCRLDLRRWGATYQKNSQRPYFEGMLY